MSCIPEIITLVKKGFFSYNTITKIVPKYKLKRLIISFTRYIKMGVKCQINMKFEKL